MFKIEIFIFSGIFFALFFGMFFIYNILKFPAGNDKMLEVAEAIQCGAKTYLYRQYKTIFFVGIFVSLFIYLFLGLFYLLGFIIGAFLSSFVGFIGMYISVNSNVRTANAARISTLSKALDISFKAGSVTGLLVVALSIFGIFFFYKTLLYFNVELRLILNSLVALGLGASLISIFARLGGGIFTKGADVGADLVGKLEIGIPEDDSRNPAVIADNVGDNVGDCAGMAADLFETYSVTIVASMLLIGILYNGDNKNILLLYPLLIGTSCVFSTIIGIYFVRLTSDNIMLALYKGFFATGCVSFIVLYFVTKNTIYFDYSYLISDIVINGLDLYYCAVIGIILTALIVFVTEYYTSTSYTPVRSLSRASLNGHAINIIKGLSISMEATTLPVIFISISILVSYNIAGVLGISIAATSMLSLCGIIVALDAYGPVTDNAGGIAEMSNLDSIVRSKTDALDAVGNTTKAITKGYAIGSAGLASLVLFAAYNEDLIYYFPFLNFDFTLKNPFVVVGLFIGGLIPYLFSSYALNAVGVVGGKVVLEVRRQFNEISGLLEGKVKPDYSITVDLLTKEAIKEMIFPSLLPIITPLLLYFVIFLFFGIENAFVSLGALLLGTIVTGLFVAISMTSGGGAWDNAKKYIEDGNYGGKGSDAHKASITGDTVGDPYKDTAGPAINPLIKIVNIIALLLIIISHRFF